MERKGKANKKDCGTEAAKETTTGKTLMGSEHESTILAELRKLRQEHTEAANDNRKALARLETNMKDHGKNSLFGEMSSKRRGKAGKHRGQNRAVGEIHCLSASTRG
ncbi:hypothetical protein NFI96_008938 [Prochilodus magdalenae]|nr:hypothetical protein NFI96_002814 [Prochilodus magdalenae]KAI4905220.1 hypothetical protein NFI96_008938 [Prochilodus magdalenae]